MNEGLVWKMGITLVYQSIFSLITRGLKQKAFCLSSEELGPKEKGKREARLLPALEEAGQKPRNVIASGHMQGPGNGFSPAASRENAVSHHLDHSLLGCVSEVSGPEDSKSSVLKASTPEAIGHSSDTEN